jgi:hypothetical protein
MGVGQGMLSGENWMCSDGQTLRTLFVNTPSSNLQVYKHSDQDSSDNVNTVATQATNGGMRRKDIKVKATQ